MTQAIRDKDFECVTCPHCDSAEVEMISLFAGAASEVLFQCTPCRTCFTWVKWRGALPPSPADAAERR